VWIPAQLRGDLSAYLASLERVLALGPERLWPAHGPVIDDPERLLRSYVEHRHEREQQVVAALRHGDSTAEAIVDRIYQGLKASLVPLAAHGIEAHLIKLEREGRARRAAGRWHLVER
jgi:glyoxylase-like metal-dependent hydrolase (beta-lactamase superfamily II)